MTPIQTVIFCGRTRNFKTKVLLSAFIPGLPGKQRYHDAPGLSILINLDVLPRRCVEHPLPLQRCHPRLMMSSRSLGSYGLSGQSVRLDAWDRGWSRMIVTSGDIMASPSGRSVWVLTSQVNCGPKLGSVTSLYRHCTSLWHGANMVKRGIRCLFCFVFQQPGWCFLNTW